MRRKTKTMNRTKAQLLEIQKKLEDLMDSDATQEEAIWAVNSILYEIDVNIQPYWIEQDLECAIQLTKIQKDLLETYKKTKRMIQQTKDHFDFPDPEAERRSMFTDGLNEEDFEF